MCIIQQMYVKHMLLKKRETPPPEIKKGIQPRYTKAKFTLFGSSPTSRDDNPHEERSEALGQYEKHLL